MHPAIDTISPRLVTIALLGAGGCMSGHCFDDASDTFVVQDVGESTTIALNASADLVIDFASSNLDVQLRPGALEIRCLEEGYGNIDLALVGGAACESRVDVECRAPGEPPSSVIDDPTGDFYDPSDPETPSTGAPEGDIVEVSVSVEEVGGVDRVHTTITVTTSALIPTTLPDGLDWLNCQILLAGAGPTDGPAELLGQVFYSQGDLTATGLVESKSRYAGGRWEPVGGADFLSLRDGRLEMTFTGFQLITAAGPALEAMGSDIEISAICTQRRDGVVAGDRSDVVVATGLGERLTE